MKFLITGGTGFVGSFLTQQLLENGHEVTVIGRSSAPVVRSGRLHAISADTTRKGSWQNALKDVDAVINLAGMSIFHRWTSAYKQQIYDSRILTTRHVVEGMTGDRPQTLISTSAVGYYGSRGDDILTEAEPCGADFLSLVGKDWEHEAFEAEKKNVRVVPAGVEDATGMAQAAGCGVAAVSLFRTSPARPAKENQHEDRSCFRRRCVDVAALWPEPLFHRLHSRGEEDSQPGDEG